MASMRRAAFCGLVIASCAAFMAMSRAADARTPLNSSVLVFDQVMLRTADNRVRWAALLPNRRLQLVLTVHCRLDDQGQVLEFGMLQDRRRGEDTPDNFTSADEQLCELIQTEVREAFAAANQHRAKLSILLHLDAVGPHSVWRNEISLDPISDVHGISFQKLAITPLVQAAGTEKMPLEISLAGEMGRSVFLYADQYREIISQLKQATPNTRVGIGLNFSDVDDGVIKRAPPSTRGQRSAAVTELLAVCDFLGVSLYAPLQAAPSETHFAESLYQFRQELAATGVAVPQNLPVQIAEVALGGGNGKPAFSVQRAMAEPWEGIGYGTANPWDQSSLRQLRRQFYKALLTFLAQEGSAGSSEMDIEAAFLWSEGSWDPQGLLDARYRDPTISAAIRWHNAQQPQTKSSVKN